MMQIPTIKRLFTRRSGRLLSATLAMLVAATISSQATAQESGLLKYLSGASPARPAASRASIQNGGSNYQVMSASAANVRTAASSSRSPVQNVNGYRGRIGTAIQSGGYAQASSAATPVQQVGFQKGCNSCGTSSCGGSCGGGSYRVGGMGRYVSGGGFACGTSCAPYRFASVDVLYMERRGQEQFTLSPHFRMDDFGFETAARVTVGSVPDCIHGCEFTFTGPMEWDRRGSVANAAGGLSTLLIPGNPVAAGDLSAFNDSTFQSQVHTSEYWSAEANKTLIGWDVVKLLVGARYIDYDENYLYYSQNTAGETGLLQSSTDNQLFGGQVGVDLLYPMGRFAYADFRTRAGVFLNLADADVALANAGGVAFANSSDDEQIAGVFELGAGMRYHLGEALTVRAGTEMWYLTGLATTPDQVGQVVRPSLGRRVDMDQDIFFYGLTFGAEFRF